MAKLIATDYSSIKLLLDTKDKHRTKIGLNTFAHLRSDYISIYLHKSEIVRLHPDGDVEFSFDGWDTPTTKNRINQFLGNRSTFHRDHILYLDGMRINTHDWYNVSSEDINA